MSITTTPVSDLQQQLIDVLADRGIAAEFNGDFLNGSAKVTIKGKSKVQQFGVAFDDPATLDGARVTRNLRGTYAEAFARDAFFETIRIGQGEAEALKFANECRAKGVRIGASKVWIDAHADQLTPVPDAE